MIFSFESIKGNRWITRNYETVALTYVVSNSVRPRLIVTVSQQHVAEAEPAEVPKSMSTRAQWADVADGASCDFCACRYSHWWTRSTPGATWLPLNQWERAKAGMLNVNYADRIIHYFRHGLIHSRSSLLGVEILFVRCLGSRVHLGTKCDRSRVKIYFYKSAISARSKGPKQIL